MTDGARPAKLAIMATIVVWSSRELTLGEKAVWWRDWTLDRGGPDACYADAAGLSAALGGSVTPGSVETIRQRLKRLGLHEPLRRAEGRNLGWVATLPAACARPRTGKEAVALAVLLDDYIRKRDEGLTLEGGTQVLPSERESRTEVPPRRVGRQNPGSTAKSEGASGGGGGAPFSESAQAQLPSAVVPSEKRGKKGTGSTEPEPEKGRGGEPEHVRDGVQRHMRRLAGGDV